MSEKVISRTRCDYFGWKWTLGPEKRTGENLWTSDWRCQCEEDCPFCWKYGNKNTHSLCFFDRKLETAFYRGPVSHETFKNYLISQLRELIDDNVQVHIVGDTSVLSDSLRREIEECEKDTAKNDGLILNVAINYGGRMEIVHAVKSIAEKVRNGELLPEQITEEDVSSALYPSDQMDVDLLIRTGGEYRISNFLLWQASYSELYFTPVLWPDFTEEELKKAVDWFEGRDRRFGGLTEET